MKIASLALGGKFLDALKTFPKFLILPIVCTVHNNFQHTTNSVEPKNTLKRNDVDVVWATIQKRFKFSFECVGNTYTYGSTNLSVH